MVAWERWPTLGSLHGHPFPVPDSFCQPCCLEADLRAEIGSSLASLAVTHSGFSLSQIPLPHTESLTWVGQTPWDLGP